MNNLIRTGHNIITSCKYPSGVRNFGDSHRQISRMYEQILGNSPKLDEFNGYMDYYNARETFDIRMQKLIQMNLWAGANISKKVVGKHKIPRYLYHITTRNNYNRMLQDGYLRISEDCARGQGLYMFEMQNMLKHYKDFDGNRNLGLLLEQVIGKNGSDAILLRIPTNKMDAGMLVIRCNTGGGQNGMNSCTKVAIGDSALASKLYKQRKVALEYIYPEKISMDNITVVGSSKTDIQEPITENAILKMWINLTKNQPEQKGFLNHKFKPEPRKNPFYENRHSTHSTKSEQIKFNPL